MKLQSKLVVAFIAVTLVARAPACGPFFPNMMLVNGDEPVLTAPVARFYAELARAQARLKLPKPAHAFVEATNELHEATRDADAVDLRAALLKRGDGTNDIARIVDAYAVEREKLIKFKAERESSPKWTWATGEGQELPTPVFPNVSVPEGLPDEFADYFRGAIAWHQSDTNGARTAWTALLARPDTERRYKSTWAAFMLARSWEDEDAGKAATFFGMTRALSKDGFADSLGLAASSIGWEARVHLKKSRFDRAIDMYLEQLASGDNSAYASLRFTAERAIQAGPKVLQSLATNRNAQAVISALLVSHSSDYWRNDDSAEHAMLWLNAIERASVSDVDLAEQLALANYQAGRFDAAQRWVKRAPSSPVSQWLQAKLLLRAGKANEAAKLLAKITRSFPLVEPTNAANKSLSENLYVPNGDDEALTAGRQLLGELGVLRLHRHEYTQALDALLRAGFWSDVAYVAERVLSVDDLKSYVDFNWPEVATDSEDDQQMPTELRPSTLSKNIRYLLARRLVRNERRNDARVYFPEEWLASFDQLTAALVIAEDDAQPKEQRATHYYAAAWIVRTNGMELMGTEGAPDFTVWAGNHEYGPTRDDRESFSTNAVTGASPDELRRAQSHSVEPVHRWHYRGHAAALAYEAAKLLPNNDDRTARALYWAGRWVQDLNAADVFYKLLVRRCRKTELGNAADEWRWFPRLDVDGRPLPSPRIIAQLQPVTAEIEEEVPEAESPGDDPQ